MKRFHSILHALLAVTFSGPLLAQLAIQPFIAPPTLHATPKPGAARALAVKTTPANCDPAGDISRAGDVVTVNLTAIENVNEINNPGNPSGYKDKVKLRSYGGCLSGPMIETAPGTTLRVHLDNRLDTNDPTCPGGHDPPDYKPGCFNTINLHFHGLHVSPSGNSDNVLLNIAPATKFEFEVNIPEDHPAGTFWYHPHRHGSTATQVASGASGALIVRGNRTFTGGAPGDVDTILHDAAGNRLKEQVFLFQQIPYACFDNGKIITNADGTWSCPPAHTPGVVEDFDAQLSSPKVWDQSGRFTSINGAVQPTLMGIKAGEIQRWRFIHGGIHDTINVQVIPMVTKGPNAKLAFQGGLAGTPAQQEKVVQEVCPTTVPDSEPPVEQVPQFEIAVDGLTRNSMRRIGGQSISGGMGTNFLQPGYRSDVLIVFPHAGTYCVLNQAATPNERVKGQGPTTAQLLATVVVQAGKPIATDLEKYLEQALYDGNKGDKGLPDAALKGLLTGDLTPWRGMSDLKDEAVASDLQKVNFVIGSVSTPPPACPPPPAVPATVFYVNCNMYDPDRIDFTRQVGTTDDWQLTSKGGFAEPHIFHIHVNPFEVMDVKDEASGKSIFGPHGECLVKPDDRGLQNQYCGMWHTVRDTIFVQNGYQVMVRTKYQRYIGEFVIHCHILDHEDSGMMTNIQIVPDASAAGGGIGMPGMKHALGKPN